MSPQPSSVRERLLDNGARLTLGFQPVDLIGCLALIAAGVGLNDVGIDGEAFALNKTCVHARSHHRLEHMAQNIAVAKPPTAIDRERRISGTLSSRSSRQNHR
jgi:hypothetical protein